MSSHRSSAMDSPTDNIRKRVCKACDRCRLKKSKVCPKLEYAHDVDIVLTLCSVMALAHAVDAKQTMQFACLARGKKPKTRCIPKGKLSCSVPNSHGIDIGSYVEMLEQQQGQLVAGLRELYTRLRNSQGWPGAPLREAQGGHPLTHDILERLDLLHPNSDSNNNYEGFEEDCSRMQQRLLDRGAPYTHRRGSISSESEHGHTSSSSSYSGTPTTKSMPFTDPFARHKAPPTPPMNSPFPRQSQIDVPIKQEAPMVSTTFLNTGEMDPSTSTRPAWPTDAMMMDEPIDFSKSMYAFDTFNSFDSNAMMLDPCVINTGGSLMPDWNDPNDLDFSTFINNPVGA